MLNKINLVGAVVLLLLGLLLAIGYPKDGVKSNAQTLNQKEENYTPILTREGNAKNFGTNTDNSSDNSNVEVKSIIHETTSGVHKVKSKITHKAVVKTKRPIRKIIQKPVKKKVTLTPPPPPKEEEDDEGC